MIRAVALVAGLLLGLALAVVLEGRVAHLALLPERWRPTMPAGLDPDSGLTRGSLALEIAPGVPVSLGWQLRGVDREGLVLALRLAGSGVDLAGPARLAPSGGGSVQIHDAAGTVDLAAGLGRLAALGLRGRVTLTGLAARYTPATPHLQVQRASADWTEATMDGAPLGHVEITLSEGELGSWLAAIAADGPALSLQAQARGTGPTAMLEGALTAGPEMPPGWARWADQTLTRTATGWALARDLALTDLLAPGLAPIAP